MTISTRLLLKLIFIVSLFQGILTSYWHFNLAVYCCDALVFVLAVVLLFFGRKRQKEIRGISYIVLGFSVLSLISVLYNQVAAPQVLWGIRNYYRFFLLFFLCIHWFKEKDVQWMVKVYEITFPIHIIMTFFQYFVQDINQDRLGGIWGKEIGCNGALVIYFSVLLCIELYKYHRKQITAKKLFVYIALMGINAAMAEIKYFFYILVIVFLAYIVVSRTKKRIAAVFIILCLVIPSSTILLSSIFPEFDNFFSTEYVNDVLQQESYSNEDDIARAAVFERLTPIIRKWNDSDVNLWIGIGLGNADYSGTIDAVNSDFYEEYSYLNYTWLLTAYLFIELGYTGLILYIGFFAVILIQSIYRYMKKKEDRYLFSVLLSLICMMLIIYNSSLRSNYAYMIFFAISIPYIFKQDQLFENIKLPKIRLVAGRF